MIIHFSDVNFFAAGFSGREAVCEDIDFKQT